MKTPKAIKLASGRWRVQVKVKGVRYSITKDTKKDAEKAAILLKMSPEQRIVKMTYGEAIDAYLAKYKKSLKPSTLQLYTYVRQHRFQALMDLPLSASVDMQAIVDSENLAASTLRPCYAVITAALKDLKLTPQKVRFAKEAKKERPFLNPEQIQIFIKAIEGDRYELPYLLCLHSLRCSEMLALKKDQVYGGWIHVSGAITRSLEGYVYVPSNKTDASTRSIPIFIPRIEELVNASPEGTLCPYSVRGMTAHLQTILKHNDLPICSLHSLRHSFATLCYFADGVSELSAMKWGGWSDYRTMREIYTHLAEQQEKRDINKLKLAFQPDSDIIKE